MSNVELSTRGGGCAVDIRLLKPPTPREPNSTFTIQHSTFTICSSDRSDSGLRATREQSHDPKKQTPRRRGGAVGTAMRPELVLLLRLGLRGRGRARGGGCPGGGRRGGGSARGGGVGRDRRRRRSRARRRRRVGRRHRARRAGGGRIGRAGGGRAYRGGGRGGGVRVGSL